MFRNLFSRFQNARRLGPVSRWNSLAGKVRRPRLHSYRPFIGLLEDRTLLSFLPRVTYDVGSFPRWVTVGHFHDPKILDIAASNFGSGTVSILLGNGDGTFQPAQPRDYPYGGGGNGNSAVGDFRGSGVFDLAVANGNDVSVLLGNGNGSFLPAVHYPAGTTPIEVAVGHFYDPNILDLAVTNLNSSNVSILRGNGDGTFQAPLNYYAGSQPGGLAVADLRHNGVFDLVVSNFTGGHTLSVLLGNGDGTFQSPVPYDVGITPGQPVVGDFNGDGIPDLAVDNWNSGTVSVLLGNGDGTFRPAQPRDYDAGPDFPNTLATGDFRQTGVLDLVVTNRNSAVVSILLGNGDGTFQAPCSYDAGLFPAGLSVAGDFNGDGFPDLAFSNATDPGTVSVLINAADWDGGCGPHPPRTSVPDRALPSQPQREGVAALVAASRRQAVSSLPLTSTDVHRSLVQQSSVPTETGQPVQPQAAVAPRAVLTTRHAHETVFERWGDPVVDVLAWNLAR
jgi:hypothetical protein